MSYLHKIVPSPLLCLLKICVQQLFAESSTGTTEARGRAKSEGYHGRLLLWIGCSLQRGVCSFHLQLATFLPCLLDFESTVRWNAFRVPFETNLSPEALSSLSIKNLKFPTVALEILVSSALLMLF